MNIEKIVCSSTPERVEQRRNLYVGEIIIA